MKSAMGMCFNWKVLAGLGVVAGVVVMLAPGSALAFLPFLLLAACPLSMVAMMLAMRGMHGDEPAKGQSPEQLQQRLAQLAEEQQSVEAKLAAEPLPSALQGTPTEASR